ncbi:MAG TPA: universal stress protein [Dehalococcoidia bacterium]|nr:universal stress protein [Dehalococcoidia bacterium]
MAFRKILVPVIGTKADEEAIRLGCQLASKNKAKICVVYVITIKRALPLNAEIEPEIRKAEDILDRMEGVAEEEGYEIETDLIQARDAGPAIVDEAVEREVDLILIGIAYKTRFGQFSLGNVVPYILKNASCRVILYHQPGK